MFKTGGHQPTWSFSFSIILLWTTAGIPRWALKPWGPASHPVLASEIVGMDCRCFYGFYPKEAVSFPMAPAIIKSHSLHIKQKKKDGKGKQQDPLPYRYGFAFFSHSGWDAELGVSTPPRSAFFVSSFFLLAFVCFFLRFLFSSFLVDSSFLMFLMFLFCFTFYLLLVFVFPDVVFFSGYLDHFEGTHTKDNQKLASVWPYLIFIYVPYLSILLLYAICLMIFGCFHPVTCRYACELFRRTPRCPGFLKQHFFSSSVSSTAGGCSSVSCAQLVGMSFAVNSQTIGVPSRKTSEPMGFLMPNCLFYDISYFFDLFPHPQRRKNTISTTLSH